MKSYQTKCCPRCGEGGMTRENNHRRFKVPRKNASDPGFVLYNCDWNVDYFEETNIMRRNSIKEEDGTV